MQLSVTGHHVEVTAPLRSYVEKKLERLVRHSDHVIDAHCVLTVEKLSQRAETTLAPARRHRARAGGAPGHVRGDRRADRQARATGAQAQGEADRPSRRRGAEGHPPLGPACEPATACRSSSSAAFPGPARAWRCTCSRTSATTASTTCRPRCSRPSSPTPCAAARRSTIEPRSASMRATATPRSARCRR